MTSRRADVVVVGGGPAGRAVTARLAHHGVGVTLIDPSPSAPWQPTYGLWADEVPDWLPDEVIAADLPDAPVVTRAGHQRELDRTYRVLSTVLLQRALDLSGATVLTGRVSAVRGPHVTVADGPVLTAGLVIDASGVTAGPRRPGRSRTDHVPAEQTAYGLMLTPDDADLTGSPMAFMDWRADHGEDGWPTFLYTIPLGGNRVLFEETSLARRPGLATSVLERRLRARLAHRGVTVPAAAAVEHVAFRVDRPLNPGGGGLVPFGAAAPLMHPATGYSLGASLMLADEVAAAVAEDLAGGGVAAAAAARQVIWPAGARVVHHLRMRGLEAVLALPPGGTGDFFDLFFDLPGYHQRAYLSERRDPVAVAAAMWALFRAADGPLRRHLLRWGMPAAGRAPVAAS